MSQIDFKQYPKIYPYVKDLIGKDYFKNNEYGLDNETYLRIIGEWVDFYEKNIETAVKNTMLIYELTCGETGYSVLGSDWERRKNVFKIKNQMTEKHCRKVWRDNFISCISRLRQHILDRYQDIKGGATGLLTTCSFIVEFINSDSKGVKKIAVSNFSMELNIGIGLHSEIDIMKVKNI